MTPPVLITSSVIAQDQEVKLTDEDQRLALTVESIGQWLKIDPSIHLVICDGSDYDFGPILHDLFPNSSIETLHFLNDRELLELHGRGYGEGEIVRFALQNSRYISESGVFAKCTAKLWVQNYLQCTHSWREGFGFKAIFSNIFSFLNQTRLLQIDTRFYLASKSYYLRYFEWAHLSINKQAGHGLEECFRDIVLRNQIKRSFMNVYPVIRGTGGGTGVPYEYSFKRKIKEELRLKIARKSSNYGDYFN